MQLQPVHLSPEQYKSLRLQARRALGRVSERIHYVLLFSRGRSLQEIASVFETDARTVSTWLHRFQEEGLEGLDDRPRSGRPRLANVAAQVQATRCLEAAPEQVGWERTTWTRALLRLYLGQQLGTWLSVRSVSRLIRRLGFVWSRPKLTLKEADSQAKEREQAIQEAIALHPDAPRLYADECDVHQLPIIRGQYQRRGRQAEVPTPGNNKKQAVFGFLNVRTGDWHYFLTARKRSVEFLACLHELYARYPSGPILLLVDNASIHKSRMTLRWLEHHPRFIVRYLPAYSGHQTNPVEKVWWALKAEVCANHMYPCIEAVQDAIIGYFARFTPMDALRLTGNLPRQSADTSGPSGSSCATGNYALAA